MAVFTRTINTQDSRMIQKLSTVSGQVPTVAPSDNHVDGSWDSLDVYIGELFMNSADGKMWSRTSNGIKEIFIVPSTVANGDTFYLNASGGITRLPIGTSGQVLSVSSGGVPSWDNVLNAGPDLVTFKLSLSAAQLLSGGNFDITELAAPGAGYAWEVIAASEKYTYGTVAYDNLTIRIKTNNASSFQFNDGAVFTAYVFNDFAMLDRESVSPKQLVENEKVFVVVGTSTTGNGTLIVYGTARKIAL